ncbi:MAG: cytochrome c peroxidase [bacterium]
MRTRSARFLAPIALLAAAMVWWPHTSLNSVGPRQGTALRAAFDAGLDSIIVALDSVPSADSMRRVRRKYKRVEALVEHFAPGVARVLNGPLPDDDDAPPLPLGAPAAFQRGDVAVARQALTRLRNTTHLITVSDADALDAMRVEIARITTLGLAGVDVTTPDDAIPEAAEAIEGMRSVARSASDNDRSRTGRWIEVDTTLRNAAIQLRRDSSFDHFDRLAFIVQFAQPAARAIIRARTSLGGRIPPRRTLWRDAAASVFDSGAFDASAFAPEYAPASTTALVTLGRHLFFDPRLSGPQTRSCASCHIPSQAFSDGRARALTLNDSGRATARNTPTLLNAAWQPLLFADERARSLEEQAGTVLASPGEMQSSASLAATRIANDASYRLDFARALAPRPDSAISEMSVRVALAAYVRSLTTLNSRFDRAARGDAGAMSAIERGGFNLFMGKARCGTCHFAPLFNGTMPPEFASSEPEIIGVPDADQGRAAVDHQEVHRFAFRVPTLRNVALTAPYMHNGAFATLDDVVAFYNKGGGQRRTLTLPHGALHLTGLERRALVAFLYTLTDTVVTSAGTELR